MEKFKRKDVTHLQENLSRLVKKPAHLTITDNTHSMIHIRPSGSGYKVRLHHMEFSGSFCQEPQQESTFGFAKLCYRQFT
jgi:hypothetical protein